MHQGHFSSTEEHALSLDGLSWRQGSVVFPHPLPPLLRDRAELVKERVPGWATARALTAGWVWTGLGRAEPWNVSAAKKPAISPMARQYWKPRIHTYPDGEVATVRGLRLTTPEVTTAELLVHPGIDEIVCSQLFVLTDEPQLSKCLEALRLRTLSDTGAHRVKIRTLLLRSWWERHPFVTR